LPFVFPSLNREGLGESLGNPRKAFVIWKKLKKNINKIQIIYSNDTIISAKTFAFQEKRLSLQKIYQ
jgi:hypothetical protein